MNRYLYVTCLAVACVWLFSALCPAPAMADFVPNKDTDYQVDIDKVIYSDQVGRVINDDFSVKPTDDDGVPLTSTAQIAFFQVAQYAEDHQGVYQYNIQADSESTPAAYLQRISNDDDQEYTVRLAIDPDQGSFAWYPLVLGDTTARNIDLSVSFKNFKNITKSQTGFHFELVAGGCRLTALWFTGTRSNGKVYKDALIFYGSILGTNGTTYPVSDEDGYPVEDIITGISDPYNTTVTLRLVIGTDNSSGEAYQGGTLSASYKIDDNDTVPFFEGSTLKVRQVTGYEGTYTDDYGVEHSYDTGDSVGLYAFPFVNIYTAHYSAGDSSSSKTVVDEHVSGNCFISGAISE